MSFQPYLLSPLDHAIPPSNMAFFFAFHLDNPPSAIPILDTAISYVIAKLPFLTGDVAIATVKDKINIRQVQPSPSPSIPMFQARHHPGLCLEQNTPQSVSFDDVFNDSYAPVPFDILPSEAHPVIRFQANILDDGILFCVYFHHTAMDAVGVFTVMEMVAGFCRSEMSVDIKTTLGIQAQVRERLNEKISQSDAETDTNTHDQPGWAGMQGEGARVISRKVTFSAERIRLLHDTCVELLLEKGISDMTLSLNNIVTALIWRCIYHARFSQRDDKMSTLAFAMDIRRRIRPPIPSAYIGNGFIGTHTQPIPMTTTTSESPTKEEIELILTLALEIKKSITAVDDTHIRSLISQVQHTHDWGAVVVGQGDVTLSSLRALPFYELDFGTELGKMKRFDIPDSRVDGLVWILPRVDEDWEVRVCLQEDAMGRFFEDELVRWLDG